MELILFVGIQASGKTTFYKENFLKSHIRISMDQLRTRNKEEQFINTCLNTQHPFVVDNTNPTKADRAKYIAVAKAKKFKVTGYYFQSKLAESLDRNDGREGKERIPEVGIKGTHRKLELPGFDEGFDELYYVKIENGSFKINQWTDEI